jgi:hypothetical protein
MVRKACATLALAGLAACREEPVPSPWPRAASELVLTRRVLAELPAVGHITDLFVEGAEVLVAGTSGVARLERASGKVLSAARYALPSPPWIDARFHDVDGDGKREIVRAQDGWVGPTAVLELDGSTRWVKPMPMRAREPLDVEGDGRLEFLVGEPNADLVWLLDHEGVPRWQRSWGSTQTGVATADLDGDGTRELLFADGDSVQVCTATGERLTAVAPPEAGYVNALRAVDGLPGHVGARLLLGAYSTARERQLWWACSERLEPLGLVALGETVFEEEHALREPLERDPPLGLAVFSEVHPAATAGFSATWLRVALFDAHGDCVYDDPIAGTEAATPGRGAHLVLSAYPLRLLVGYGPTLWELAE